MKLRFRPNSIVSALTAISLTTASAASAQTGQPASAVPGSADELLTLEPTPRRIAELDFPLHPSVAPSPDGRLIAVMQTRPDPVLWVVPSDGSEPFAFRKMWAAFKPRWSPSSKRIGFIAAIGPPRIWTVEVDSATGRPIDPPRLLIRTGANAFAFAPDGERIALVASRSTAAGASEIHIVHWESRASRVLLRESGAIYWLDWAPDGKSIYYGIVSPTKAGPEVHQVRRVALGGGPPRTVASAGEFLGLSPNGANLVCLAPEEEAGSRTTLSLLRSDGAPLARVRLGSQPPSLRWAADSRALIQVVGTDAGYELQELRVLDPR